MDTFGIGDAVKRKKKVYVESSIISYLTARTSRDTIKRAKQEATRKWWEIRSRYDLYVSTAVMDEIEDGDPEAAKLRVKAVANIKILDYTEATLELARRLIACNAIPAKKSDDATHIAISAIHEMDLILTWNHAHIANQNILEKIRETIKNFGFTPPLLVDPNFILEDEHED